MIPRRSTFLALLGALCLMPVACDEAGRGARDEVTIGTKNFTEQYILGELMAQILEARTDLHVNRRFNLGGTMICHGALVEGDIGLYAEYTGTGLLAVLKRKPLDDPERTYDVVAEAYRTQFACQWLQPFGFNNSYAIVVRAPDADARNWRAIGDLAEHAPQLRAGFTAEFVERPDGYPGFKEAYGFQFGSVKELDPGLMYRAIAANEVDVICGFATDGRIAAYALNPLLDDRRFFPPYHAAPVVRLDLLEKHPEIADVLGLLGNAIDDATMQRLNHAVDENGRSPRDVAAEFLATVGEGTTGAEGERSAVRSEQ